jgi:dihydromonapterin reductase/dihydrofolate reductase
MKKDGILITGVARRVGLHLAKTFLDRGFTVIGTFRSEHPTLEGLADAGADLYQCDFYDESAVNALVDSITGRYSSLRAIIHNASDWLPEGNTVPASEVMQRMMQVHVTAPYLLNLALAPLLEACSGPHADIIHVGDYVSTRGSKKHIAYAASKAAQDNLTLSFSASLAPRVKVNSVAPALVMFNDGDDEVYRQKARSKSLMQREAGLDEFQRAIDYLLESVYVTGRTLHMDGGRHLKVA